MGDDRLGGEAEKPRSTPSIHVTLAEYGALRAEIDRRAGTQWNVFALQVASAGAIGSFALSSRSNIELLLLIPLSSYVLGGRYILHDYHIKLIHTYIRTCLSPRLDNALQWEQWKTATTTSDTDPNKWLTIAGWNPAHPTRLAFVGVAALALLAALAEGIYLWTTTKPGWWIITGYIILWLLGAITTIYLSRSYNKSG